MNKSSKQSNVEARFSLIDAVIILIVILAVVGVYFRYNIVDFLTDSKDLKDYNITYVIEDVRYTTPEYIGVGDKFFFADSGEYLGTVINESENMGALSITPASEYMTDNKGNVVEVLYPDNESRVNAKGRLSCVGKYSDDGGFMVAGNTYIASGNQISVKSEYVTVTIKVLSIDEAVEATKK